MFVVRTLVLVLGTEVPTTNCYGGAMSTMGYAYANLGTPTTGVSHKLIGLTQRLSKTLIINWINKGQGRKN